MVEDSGYDFNTRTVELAASNVRAVESVGTGRCRPQELSTSTVPPISQLRNKLEKVNVLNIPFYQIYPQSVTHRPRSALKAPLYSRGLDAAELRPVGSRAAQSRLLRPVAPNNHQLALAAAKIVQRRSCWSDFGLYSHTAESNGSMLLELALRKRVRIGISQSSQLWIKYSDRSLHFSTSLHLRNVLPSP